MVMGDLEIEAPDMHIDRVLDRSWNVVAGLGRTLAEGADVRQGRYGNEEIFRSSLRYRSSESKSVSPSQPDPWWHVI